MTYAIKKSIVLNLSINMLKKLTKYAKLRQASKVITTTVRSQSTQESCQHITVTAKNNRTARH